MLVFGFLGVTFYVSSRAETNTATVTNTSNATLSTECGKRITNYSYQVPFGNAIWNQPICGRTKHPKSSDYVNRFIEWGHLNDGSASADVNNGKISNDPGFPDPTLIDPYAGLFTIPVYKASDSTTETRILTSVYDSNLDGDDLPYQDPRRTAPDSKIPWNPNWKTGKGGDNAMIILDDRTGTTQGRIYVISGYQPAGFDATRQCGLGLVIYPNRICTYTVDVGRDLNGDYANYQTYEGYIKNRGVGLSMYATLVTPEEVDAGEIRHAIAISMPNTGFGPICTKAQLGTPAEGTTCGTAVAPATKFEWGGQPNHPIMPEPFKSLYGIDKSIPEGMRFAIDISDPQIETWISSREDLRTNQRRAETARIFARALRDYGMMVVDTNSSRPNIQHAGGANPEAAQIWTNLGMGPDEKDNMLDGLVNSQNLYVVDPPTATCKDGTTSKNYCEWTSIKYAGTVTPTYSPADFNKDSKIDIVDLNFFVSNWDPNGAKPASPADINKDTKVDIVDLNFLVSSWTR